VKTDAYGRPLFPSEAQAFQFQKRSAREHGCYSGVIKNGDGLWSLLYDPQARV
jgi:hypothetical protein